MQDATGRKIAAPQKVVFEARMASGERLPERPITDNRETSCSDIRKDHDLTSVLVTASLWLTAVASLETARKDMRAKGARMIRRVLNRLARMEATDPELWFHADIRVAWLTLNYAAQGDADPFARAWVQVFGQHPDRGIPKLLERERQLLGELAPEPAASPTQVSVVQSKAPTQEKAAWPLPKRKPPLSSRSPKSAPASRVS